MENTKFTVVTNPETLHAEECSNVRQGDIPALVADFLEAGVLRIAIHPMHIAGPGTQKSPDTT